MFWVLRSRGDLPRNGGGQRDSGVDESRQMIRRKNKKKGFAIAVEGGDEEQ